MKKVRIHAIVTGNDGTTGTTSPTFTAAFTKKKLIDLVAALKTIFAGADIQILFHPAADITEVQNAVLNEDCPFKDGKIVVPPMSVDDLTGNPNVVAQRKFAENLKGSLVIYFRDFSVDKYEYLNEKGETKRDTPWQFSSDVHLYVRYSKTDESDRVAHEIGHYLHLAHTFGPNPKTVAEAAQMIKDAVESGTVAKADGANVFDPDRGGGVLDTPADPRGLMATANGGDPCGPIGTVTVKVNFSDGTAMTYPLSPDRHNVMSYFFECMDTNTAHFSTDQKKIAHDSMETGNRKHLLANLPGAYTVVMRPETADERYIYGWKYEYFRIKYDALWKDGWRLHVLQNYVLKGEVLYTAVFRKSTAPEIQLYGFSYGAYRKQYDELWKKGWRLFILNNYIVKGQVKYTAVFRKSAADEIQLYGWSYNAYRKKYDALWKDGWRLYILTNYVIDGNVKYTAVFRKGAVAEGQLYGWLFPAYRKEYDKLWEEGWRLHILNNYRVGGKVRYTAVFRKSTSGEIQLYGWKYLDFREKLEELWDQGLRVKILNVY